MAVNIKNNAKSAIIIPGVGDIAKLDGIVAPGDTLTVDEQLVKSDFVQHLVSTGELIVTGAVIEPEPENQVLSALRGQAEMLGISVNKRWGVDRLREEITKLTETE